jgi:hypothetical protein
MVFAKPQPLFPLVRYGVTIVQEAEWKSEPIWNGQENFRQLGSDPNRPANSETFTAIRYFGRLYCRPTADLFLQKFSLGGASLNEMY